MPDAKPTAMPGSASASGFSALRLALVYAGVSALWILFSDAALERWIIDPSQMALAGAIKGWAFIAVTAALLYGLLRRRGPPQVPAQAPAVPLSRRRLLLRVLAAVVAVAAATALGVNYAVERDKRVELDRLHAVAELKVQQLQAWLEGQARDALLLADGADTQRLLRRWREHGDLRARDEWLARLKRMGPPSGFSAFSLFDENGALLWSSPGSAAVHDGAALVGLQQAQVQNRVWRQGPQRDAEGHVHTYYAVRLAEDGAPPGQRAAMLVCQLDGSAFLPGDLNDWPVPSVSGEVVLARREGDQAVFLNALRWAPAAAFQMRLPLTDNSLMMAQLFRLGAGKVRVVQGQDYRGEASFGVGRQVPGTDWVLLARVDASEVYAAAVKEALWISLAGALGVFIALAALTLARQRQQLVWAAQTQQAQADRLRALQLLGAIAEGSDDAIFAKDNEGRYTLFNAAAAVQLNRQPESVLGQDDRALFPAEEARVVMATDARVRSLQHNLTLEERLTTVHGERVFLTIKGPLRGAGGVVCGSFGISRDITALKQAEDGLRRANRALLTSRECGQALMRAESEDELLQAVTRIVVHTGGYLMAWVGLAENDEQRTVRPVAIAGNDEGYAQALQLSWADTDRGRGPTGRAIREQRPIFCKDIAGDPDFTLWRGAALARGYRSAISLPLLLRERLCLGALTLYAATPDAFDEEEIRLASQLAADMAFGIRTLRDRAARRSAEALVREERRRLTESQRLAAIGSWQIEGPALRLSWSAETYRLHGVEPGQFVPDPTAVDALVHPEDRAAHQAWRQGLLDGQAMADNEFRVALPGGGWRHLNARGRLEQARAGRSWRVVGTVQDVTAQRQAEAERLTQEARYRELFAANPHPMWVVHRETLAFLEVNQVAVAKYGYSREEFLAMTVADIRPREDLPRLMHLLGSSEAGRDEDQIWRHRLKDGSIILVKVSARNLSFGGQPAVVALALDVTARMQAESELRKLQLAVEQSPNSIVITNLRAEIEYVNAAFVHTTGYSRDELMGRNPRILHGDKVRPGDHQGLWATLTAGRTWHGVFHNKRKDGSSYVEVAHLAPVRQADGQITHYVGVKEDITEKTRIGDELDKYRLRLEELVAERTAELAEARSRAEAASRAKSAFLANMSHEIRTPMNAIVGLSFLLQRDQATPRQAERLGKIDAAALQLLSIINGILDLSKIEAGKLVLEYTDFELGHLLRLVQGLIADRAQAKGVQVSVDAGPLPCWLYGDMTRLSQALSNYADNALKFTEHGSITLRSQVLEEDAEGLLMRFEVQDTGIGIAAADLPRLFQAFEQADASTTRQYGGTGLGLALARRLAGLMGGQAGAASQPGVGSSFWLTARLSRGRAAAPAATLAASDVAATDLRRLCAGARVLLAEDEAVNREVAIELLHAAGLVVDTAVDGRQAVQYALAQSYDLLLMDVQMPVMDGFDATRALRAEPRLAALPILALTANAFEEDRRACLAAGMNDFVPKPVDPPLLYATLLRWLPQRGGPQVSTAPGPLAATDHDLDPSEQALLMAALGRIHGLDARRALVAMQGKLRAYLPLLLSLLAQHGGDPQRLTAQLAAQDYAAAQATAHRLRGAAGALGADLVQDAAAALEEALRRHDAPARLQGLCEDLCLHSASLFQALRELPALRAPAPTAAADQDQACRVLRELEPLLASDDAAANEHFDAHRGLLTATLGAVAATLGRQLESFDFPAALATLRQALAANEDQARPG